MPTSSRFEHLNTFLHTSANALAEKRMSEGHASLSSNHQARYLQKMERDTASIVSSQFTMSKAAA